MSQSRQIEKHLFKLRRCELDIIFLNSCLENHVVPTFLNFKVSNQFLHKSNIRRTAQRELLRQEIDRHHRRSGFLKRQSSRAITLFKETVSSLDFLWISSKWNNYIKKRLEVISKTHKRKLNNLISSSTNRPKSLSAEEVIFNHSSYVLNEVEKRVLSKGLNFALTPKHINVIDIATSMEVTARSLSKYCKENPNNIKSECGVTWDGVITRFKDLALNSLNFFRPPPSNITREEYSALRTLQARKDLVFIRPDKGNGVVILNREDYVQKLNNILSDNTKFINIPFTDMFKTMLSFEDDFKRKLKSTAPKIFKETAPTGSQPGRLYGLPKVHKPDLPLRPIVNSINTPNYLLAKYLVPHLQKLTESEMVIKDSFSFAKEITSKDEFKSGVMVSFDVESLFTNVPVEETIDIIVNSLYTDSTTTTLNLKKSKFKDLLTLASKECLFIFDGRLYKQTDGVAMGSPLGPVLANTFLTYHEKNWLANCPDVFKPMMYRRYIDDVFLIFKHPDDIQPFLFYLNSQHPNIRFNSETEKAGILPYLGMNIIRSPSGFSTSVYRKPTFSGLYINSDSFIPNKYKVSLVNILLHRAFMLCSNYNLLHKEVENIKSILTKNGFVLSFIEGCISRFFSNIFEPSNNAEKEKVVKEKIYIKLPYTGSHSFYIRRNIRRLIKKVFPMLELKFAFTTLERVGSRFSVKDVIPSDLASNIIYKFKCSSCSATYVGKTRRHFNVRRCEHLGITPRLGKRSKSIPNSAIFQHSIDSDHQNSHGDFSIIGRTNSGTELGIREALCIFLLKPTLNVQQDMACLELLR